MYNYTSLWDQNWLWNDPNERALVGLMAAGFILIGGPILAFFYVSSRM